MERGPLALFGAIVAVGVGPALWMGVQLGGGQVTPANPPAVSEQRPADSKELLGGTGAGAPDESGGGGSLIDSEPQGNVLPLSKSPSAKPSPSAGGEPEDAPSDPAPTVSPEPSRSANRPSVPPTESTTQPTGPADPPAGGDESGEPTDPPQPPTDDPTLPDDPSTTDGAVVAGR